MEFETAYLLDIIRSTLGILIFGIAAYYDLHTRYIPDKLWNIGVIAGAIIFCADVLTTLTPLQLTIQYAANIGVAMILGWTVYLLGYFGGADTKAITTVAVLFPTFPELSQSIPYAVPVSSPPLDLVLPLTVITFLSNTALFGLFFPVVLIARGISNIDPEQKINSILSKKVSVGAITDEHGTITDGNVYELDTNSGFRQYYTNSQNGLPTEFFTEYLEWYRTAYDDTATVDTMDIKLQEFIENHEYIELDESNALVNSIEDAEQTLQLIQESESVFMTPGFPFIVPMFLGLLSLVFIGDIFFWIMTSI